VLIRDGWHAVPTGVVRERNTIQEGVSRSASSLSGGRRGPTAIHSSSTSWWISKINRAFGYQPMREVLLHRRPA
jgi:hypothetical protein